jgi:hypothetical protein
MTYYNSRNTILNAQLIKDFVDSNIIRINIPKSFIGASLKGEDLDIISDFKSLLAPSSGSSSKDRLINNSHELTTQFDFLLADRIKESTWKELFHLLRTEFLSLNAKRIDRATTLIDHMLQSSKFTPSIIYSHLDNHKFMQSMSLAARKLLTKKSESAQYAARHIFRAIKTWAENYMSLQGESISNYAERILESNIWEAYIKLKYIYHIDFEKMLEKPVVSNNYKVKSLESILLEAPGFIASDEKSLSPVSVSSESKSSIVVLHDTPIDMELLLSHSRHATYTGSFVSDMQSEHEDSSSSSSSASSSSGDIDTEDEEEEESSKAESVSEFDYEYELESLSAETTSSGEATVLVNKLDIESTHAQARGTSTPDAVMSPRLPETSPVNHHQAIDHDHSAEIENLLSDSFDDKEQDGFLFNFDVIHPEDGAESKAPVNDSPHRKLLEFVTRSLSSRAIPQTPAEMYNRPADLRHPAAMQRPFRSPSPVGYFSSSFVKMEMEKEKRAPSPVPNTPVGMAPEAMPDLRSTLTKRSSITLALQATSPREGMLRKRASMIVKSPAASSKSKLNKRNSSKKSKLEKALATAKEDEKAIGWTSHGYRSKSGYVYVVIKKENLAGNER